MSFKNQASLASHFLANRRTARSRRHRLRLGLEQLESRRLLAGSLDNSWSWFESFRDVPRIAPSQLGPQPRSLSGVIGPHDLVASEWIVQLTAAAADSVDSLRAVDRMFDRDPIDFTVISGLGSPGLVLMRGLGVSDADVRALLESSAAIETFSINSLVEGQATPNDPEFRAGVLSGLVPINATSAWDESTGSLSTIVGVVDGGIDATHPDLYLNIWLNQGEIPETLRAQLTDLDGDGLITFYDLNNLRVLPAGIEVASTGVLATTAQLTTATPFADGANAGLVKDKNGNGRIDAIDLLDDVNWADGRDTDGNTFFDDIFGVNFRDGGSDPFPVNKPLDELGHGTHVSGIVGAVGNNNFGVVGVNWQTSLMSLRILDNNNQADAGAAIRAVNYARQMRSDLRIGDDGRVESGAAVRVLNNSWGQPGGFDQSLQKAIGQSGEQGILFVAAAGNGNILGNGVDNDETPFFPASYAAPNVIAVAALASAGDGLATFSNFGRQSVDLAAPGVSIRSTLPGGDFVFANGTSMATPHVAGAAALIWSAFPQATVNEVRTAILASSAAITRGDEILATGGRLDAAAALNADVFAPAASLVAKQNVTVGGGASAEITVEYSHRSGINTGTIGDDDLVVSRGWGPAEDVSVTLKPGSVVSSGRTVTASYIVAAPGGSWDPLDFGDYLIATAAGNVAAGSGTSTTQSRGIGSFNVRVEDTSVIYVDTLSDTAGGNSLRDAIIAANAAGAPRTIILDAGRYTIDIPHVPDPTSSFPDPDPSCGAAANQTGWSDETTGDFDVTGSITIIGNRNDLTVIDANQLDRVFKVHPAATLELTRLTVTGGLSPEDQGGGGILSAGDLLIRESIVRGNAAIALQSNVPIRGGGIAAWDGNANVLQSWIDQNESRFGGGIFFCGVAAGAVLQSTLSNNVGGGLHSHSDSDLVVNNSTLSANAGGNGAIFNGKKDGMDVANNTSRSAKISGDGNVLVFQSAASNLVPGDTNGLDDIFAFDLQTQTIERVSIASDGSEPDLGAFTPSLSADGNLVAFASLSTNLVAGDTNNVNDIYVYDRTSAALQRVSVGGSGIEGNGNSFSPMLSADGRFVAFLSDADNLVASDQNNVTDVFVHDRQTGITERVNIGVGGVEAATAAFSFSLSADGRFVSFVTNASLVPLDVNGLFDTYVFDRTLDVIERVSVSSTGEEANGDSGFSSMSGDGRFVAFDSSATNLVAGDNNAVFDIFVFDRQDGSVNRISSDPLGSESDGPSFRPSFSADGRFLAFESLATNLTPGDTNGASDVFRYDRVNDQLERVTVNPLGIEANLGSSSSSLNADGRFVAFESAATNLAPDDINQLPDVFVFDAQTGQFELPTILQPVTSTIFASQVTAAFTTSSDATIAGRVAASDVLLSKNSTVNQFAVTVSASPTVLASPFELVGPLTRVGDLPPVHRLIQGELANAAIDRGDPAFAGTLDQVGTLRTTPDIGAFEAVSGQVAGTVYVDLNENQVFDPDEPGIADVAVQASAPSGMQSVFSNADDPETLNFDETGRFEFPALNPEIVQFEVAVPPAFSVSTPRIDRALPQTTVPNGQSGFSALSANGRYTVFSSFANNLTLGDFVGFSDIFVYDKELDSIERVSFGTAPVLAEANGGSDVPVISGNGQFVAFETLASNILPGDFNGVSDVYAYDRAANSFVRVSQSSDGTPADAASNAVSMSGDGLTLAFVSLATNLVPGDTNSVTDIFVSNPLTSEIRRISVSDNSDEANDQSFSPSVSGDGRFVVFTSLASNLVPGDNNGVADVFLYDLRANTIERVSVSDSGVEGNDASLSPSINADGTFVAFNSNASNLVAGDTNGQTDVFLYNRLTKTIERISRGVDGNEANGNSFNAPRTLSAEGRFVSFVSEASNLVSDDTNNVRDVFVYDRDDGAIARVSLSAAGSEANRISFISSISADGRFVAFNSLATNLIPADDNQFADIFVAPNPLIEEGASQDVKAGSQITDFNLGLVPDPGEISGTLFEDVVQNAALDTGEPPLPGLIVFLDSNQNRLLDSDEVFTTSQSDGSYRFAGTPAFRDYTVAVQVPAGWEQVSPGKQQGFVWDIFLPPGGSVTGRDFGLRRVAGTGQSSLSSVTGRVFDDKNENGVFDAGDVPWADTVVFLDQRNFGTRDANEPAVETDADGIYTISNLGSSIVAVSTVLDDATIHTSPLGSDFTRSQFPLFDQLRPFADPQAITVADFNNDLFPDVAVALGEANQISIRLNDGRGGFLPDKIDVDLGPSGGGPTSLVVGQFNGSNSPLDIAVVNNFASNVTILSDYNGTGFDSTVAVAVGEEPIDIVTAQLGGDAGHVDLVVINKADNSLQVLTNNGAGGFTAQPPINSGGNAPVSLVTGRFDGDGFVDLALAHAAASSSDTPFGDVRVFSGDGAGGFTLTPTRYRVGATPTDLVSADFDNDGSSDLAVSNFGSNSLSILTGNSDGTFVVQPQTLGTASGAFDIAVADIDNDDDTDIVASNLLDRNISIFRNNTVTPGLTAFQPLEAVGLGQFGLAQRMPLALANFDQDSSAPGRAGTIDIVAIPTQTDTLQLLTNKLVNGAHRVQLTGLNQVAGLDFLVTPATLLPKLDAIADPFPIVEDAPLQTITLTGIAKGRSGGPPLRIVATSGDAALIPDPAVNFVDGESTATLTYTPVAQANGTAVITVTVTDAGADQTFDTADDGRTRQEFNVRVLSVEDQTILLTGSGNTFFLSQPDSQLDGVKLIDIRGSGDNLLVLDADRIRTAFAGGTINVLSNSGDSVQFDDGWKFAGASLVDGALVRTFTNAGAVLNLTGPDDFTNPINPFDVNVSGDVSALDALVGINELAKRQFSDGQSNPRGSIRDLATIDLSDFRFYDVSGDLRITALDSLRVINELARQNAGGLSEAEFLPPPPLTIHAVAPSWAKREQAADLQAAGSAGLQTRSKPVVTGPLLSVTAPAAPALSVRQLDSQNEHRDPLDVDAVDALLGTAFDSLFN